jgi:2-keto-4-pentenoate hydratase/2-oxohepta-3-ene-1,7-dioic acid hydratase in catechol pathway
MLALIQAGSAVWEALARALQEAAVGFIPVADVQMLAPLPRPPKNLICLGLNYAEHAAEQDARAPEDLVVFTKAPTAINAPYGDIPCDDNLTQELDWEVELAVIIGRPGRQIATADALNHVFGFTVLNDVTARDLQRQHKQYFLGKSLDGCCPLGPWIVSVDEVADPQALYLRTRVNGVLKQEASTADQIFGVAQAIAIISRGMTLEAGDIIATGTPAGVGFARRPPEFLRPGDVVECEVESIGTLRNRVVPIDVWQR